MVKLLHAAGLEVILDVVYNHTAEGGTRRADAELPRPGRDAVLPERRPRPVRGHHRVRQQPELRRTPRGPAGAGLAALLGERVPHRRLPVRPRRDPVPERRQRIRSAPPLPRRHRRRSGPVRRQADRRALGRRLRRLADRPLPARLGGLERPLPRRRPHLLARRPRRDRRRRPGRLRGAASRTPFPAPRAFSRPRAGPGWPRSTSSRPTTASPWPIWCPTTASTTRPTASRTATATETTAATTTASRAAPKTRTSWPSGPRPAAT